MYRVSARLGTTVTQKRGEAGPGPLPRTLSIRSVPDDIVRRLKRRAAKHHRSLQRDLLAILEDAVRAPDAMTSRAVLAEVARLGVRTPPEAASIIRKECDAR